MIPLPVVGHWPLDRKRPVIPIDGDQIERVFVALAEYDPISWLGSPSTLARVLLEQRFSVSPTGHKPRAMWPFGWCYRRLIRNDGRIGSKGLANAGHEPGVRVLSGAGLVDDAVELQP